MKKIRFPYDTYVVVAKVKSVHGLKGEDTGGKGPCRFYRPGDEVVFDRAEIHGVICYTCLTSMMFKIFSLRLGFIPPWTKNGVWEHACPDAARPVVFELKTVGQAERET